MSRVPNCPHCVNVNKFTGSNLPTNHWLRQSPNPASAVVCPVLLKTECRYCHKLGHTKSACPQSAKDAKAFERGQKRSAQPAQVQVQVRSAPVKCGGAFDALMDEDEDEDEDEKKANDAIFFAQHEYPVLAAVGHFTTFRVEDAKSASPSEPKPYTQNSSNIISYSTIAARAPLPTAVKSVVYIRNAEREPIAILRPEPEREPVKKTIIENFKPMQLNDIKRPMRAWDDDESDEEDDDDAELFEEDNSAW